MSDGLGIATFLQGFNDVYDHTALPAMRPLGFCKQLFIWIICPLLVIFTLISTTLAKRDRNLIRKDCEPSGKKVLAVINDLDLPGIKKYNKKIGATVNDYCLSLLSVSLHEYFTDELKKLPED